MLRRWLNHNITGIERYVAKMGPCQAGCFSTMATTLRRGRVSLQQCAKYLQWFFEIATRKVTQLFALRNFWSDLIKAFEIKCSEQRFEQNISQEHKWSQSFKSLAFLHGTILCIFRLRKEFKCIRKAQAELLAMRPCMSDFWSLKHY